MKMSDLLPPGYTLLRFPAWIEIQKDGRTVTSVPLPYNPISPEQWREIFAAALNSTNKQTKH
jgi:hypothetical protein